MAVFKDANGTYYVRTWYKTWKGERKQKTKRGFEKMKDAKKWEREFLAMEHTEIVKMSTLIQLYEKDLDNQLALGMIRPITHQSKKRYIAAYIKDYFGDADTNNITIAIVNEWLAYITNNPVKCQKPRLCSSTIHGIRGTLSQIFTFGMKHYGLKTNPVKQSNTPSKFEAGKRADIWELETYEIFYNSIKQERYKTLFNILYWAGLRIGEALALTPADITDNSIIVNKTWIYSIKNKQTFLPKTQNSIREIAVPSFLTEQIHNYIKTIDGIKDTDRIFPWDRSRPGNYMELKIKKLGLPYISLHTLRHSYVSNLLAQTKDFSVVAAQVGDTPATMFKHYAFPLKDSISKAVDNLEKMHKK